MTVDIAKARAQVEELRLMYAHPLIRKIGHAAADTIVALLNERDALMSLIRDEIDENRRLRVLGGAAADESITAMMERVIAERDALARDVDACAAALPGPYYMDPPDGGDVPISEQVKRMAWDAARYREFVVSGGWHRHIDGEHPEESYSYLVVGLPVDADLSCYAARKLAMDKALDEGSER